ncbi:aspartyl/glutamyl-tRNA(Asn/Gln) amidotransferasesubunit B [Striga asiatica]|uniref:Aspartyl/glutamyl-tRNA(Asn/Gln) amidotransferasesubunit B n=1 Tax=Striga asiatica TaxID=4170 RepID=A0A5A7REP2_STRAF|nr:aspartyl/glutamyl-tRNA(Asn/Gln) amidotransferasesubunit B [Striga asiatica]
MNPQVYNTWNMKKKKAKQYIYLTAPENIKPSNLTSAGRHTLPLLNILLQPVVNCKERHNPTNSVQYATRISNRCNCHSPAIDHDKRNSCSRCLACQFHSSRSSPWGTALKTLFSKFSLANIAADMPLCPSNI